MAEASQGNNSSDNDVSIFSVIFQGCRLTTY
jgi:hypothetical protein